MSQRRRLFVLLFAVTAPMVALAAIFVFTSVETARTRTERDSESIARAAALAATSFVDGHLRALQATVAGLRDAPSLATEELREEILLRLAANPEWDGMIVVGPDSVALAGSRPETAGLNLRERAYLEELFATGRPVVSDGVLSMSQGVPSVLMAAPVHFTDGTTGAVIGQVTLGTLSEELTRDLAPTEARIGLIDRAGQTLVHADPARAAALLNVSDRPEIAAAQTGALGHLEVERAGVDTLIAYSPVSSLGWVVTVAEDSDVAYADANAIARRGTLFIALATAAVVVGGWFLGGRLNRSYEAMQAARLAEAEARERAEAALRSRDEFISIASHELRNPVASIRGFGQLMQRRLARGNLQDSDLRDYIDSIATSGVYLSRLVDDLLSVSRLEGGRLQLQIEEANVMHVLRRAVAEAPLVDHPVRLDPPSEEIVARIDADRITQILVNLLENAAKYSPSGTEIAVAVTRTAESVQVAVTDRGIGLPEEDRPRLFVPFGRASNAREANIPGLGLGLYVSRRLAEAHGGALVASSAGEGRGSTFTLVLPLPAPAPVIGSADAPDSALDVDGPAPAVDVVERAPA